MADTRNDLGPNTWKRGLVGRISVWKILIAAVSRFMLYDIPVLSELNPPKMACLSSAVNDSHIPPEDDISGDSLAGLRCSGDSLN